MGIYEYHRRTRENLTGKVDTGLIPLFHFQDVVAVEEGPSLIEKVDLSCGYTINHPVLGRIGGVPLGSGNPPTWILDSDNAILDISAICWDEAPDQVTITYVIPNTNNEYIERFRDDWFKPESLEEGWTWDTENYKLRWNL